VLWKKSCKNISDSKISKKKFRSKKSIILSSFVLCGKLFGVNNSITSKHLILNSNQLEAHPKVKGESLIDNWPKLYLMFSLDLSFLFFVKN